MNSGHALVQVDMLQLFPSSSFGGLNGDRDLGGDPSSNVGVLRGGGRLCPLGGVWAAGLLGQAHPGEGHHSLVTRFVPVETSLWWAFHAWNLGRFPII